MTSPYTAVNEVRTTHTPGPWEARTFLVRGGARMSDTICHVGSSTSLPPSRSNESAANARLIAAAPELLTALIEAEAKIEKMSGGGETDFRLHLRATISKASAESSS